MPNNTLREFFRLRCRQTLEAEQHIENLFSQMVDETQHARLKAMLQQHLAGIQTEVTNLEQIVNQLAGVKRARKTSTPATEQVLVFVRGFFAGEPGLVETRRDFMSAQPQYIVDIHSALAAEELTHAQLGNYTGLIVLAKQLGENEIAGWLQQNIDTETWFREQLEGALWQIVGDLGMSHAKAA